MLSGFQKVLKKIIKVIAWTVGSLLMLLLVIALLIRVPAVQSWLTQKAVAFVEKKIGTDVSLGRILISFPKSIVLEEIFLEDQKGDTLLFAGKVSVDTDLWGLTRNEIQLNNISIRNAAAFIHREENDSSFNFTYILDAFAGDSTAVPDTLEQKGWNITMENLALEHIRVSFDDRLQGNLVKLELGKFDVDMNSFDLKNNSYSVDAILLENTKASFEQTKLLKATDDVTVKDDSATALVFSLEDLTLRNVAIDYKQSVLGENMRLNIGEAQLLPDIIDLEGQEISVKSFSLQESSFAYQKTKGDTVLPATKVNPTSTTEPGDKPWKVAVEKIYLAGNSMQYFDLTKPQQPGTVDFDHLWISALNVDAHNIRYDGDDMQLSLNKLSFHEQSGFAIESLQGTLKVSGHQATLEDFLLATGNSRLQLQASAQFRSLKNIANDYPSATIETDINESYVNVRDILYFDATFLDSLPVTLSPATRLAIDGAIQGKVNDLKIRHLVFKSFSDTYVKASGRITGLPDPRKMALDISLDKFYTTRGDLQSVLPDTLLPDSIQLPGWLNLEAKYKGTLEKADFTTSLTSDAGSVHASGDINLDSASALRGVNLTLDVKALDIGTILGKPDSVMGTLGMKARLQTNGLTPKEMTGTLAAFVDHFDFQGYEYTNLDLKGRIRDQVLSLVASMNDTNLDFVIDADYIFKDEIPRYDLTFDLKNADFEALHLSTTPIRARGMLMVDMATSDFKVLNGNVGIRKVAIFNGDDLYAVDSLLFASIDQEGRSEINIDSDLLKAKFEGSINIFGLPAVMREYFNTYYALHDSLDVKDSPRQHFTFNIELKNTDLLTDLLIPNLTTFVPGPISGEFDSQTQDLQLKMEIDAVQYGNIGIKSFLFHTSSDERSLKYNLDVDEIMVDSMRIDGLQFNGTVADNSILTSLIILDSTEREKYVLAGTFFSREKHFELRLSPNDIMLNYQHWKVPPDNYMRFGAEKFVAMNVQLVNQREKIIIDSKEQAGTPISVGFREVNLEYLVSMIAEERLLSGLLHGDINIFPDKNGMTFTSDLTVNDFRIKDIGWGNIALQVEQKVKNRFDVNFALSGNENDVRVSGFYAGGEAPTLDLTARINQFHLTSLQPLVDDQVQNLKGLVTGEITARGTMSRPDIDGGLRVAGAQFFSTYLSTNFSIDDETISFVDEGISFNAFEIADENKNKARLDGAILTRTYRDFDFRLDLSTENFRLFNTTAEDNDLYYGQVDIEAKARIRGNMTTPIVNMDIGLSEGSKLTYVVPQSEASALQAEGIVKFVDKTFEGDPFMQQISKEVSDTVKSTFRGIDLTARIELSDQETFTIVIDPITEDQLTVKGNATLTLQVDPTGDMNLAGRYEISEGTYNLSFYKFVKREFAIESGSSITWLGDPMNAQMDIKAIFNVETSPIELFSNQLTGADQNEVNQYKQRLPFMVYLNIAGELLQPEISFKLEMPMDERNAFGGNVYARLQDINTRESDLNKQVFALLILKRFISDDPFENQGAGGFESTARSSVSKILSEQLNRLSENIKGVELSFDIKSYEDYTSGQAQGKTELQLGVSKTMFNDRLVVKLSGNIDIEGEDARRDATDFIGDLALEYKVTPDGRFRITGFRNSNYDMIDGELTETGAGIIYVKDYNALSELFKANAETKN